MLDLGFEREIREIMDNFGTYFACLLKSNYYYTGMKKETRLTLLFSATFPEEIQKLAADFLRDCIKIVHPTLAFISTINYTCFCALEEWVAQQKTSRSDLSLLAILG